MLSGRQTGGLRIDMKVIAHRGWSSGPAENGLAALRRSASAVGVSGVELDVRHYARRTLVLSHDEPGSRSDLLTLDEAARFLAETRLTLLLELKQPGIGDDVILSLKAANLAERTTVFGFPENMKCLNWGRPRTVRLGIIVRYPWQAARLVRRYQPDVLLLGWDERAWTRIGFRLWWSVFSLEELGRRYSAAVVVGVAQRASDVQWLRRQNIEAAVADIAALQ
jgi:hypothetical protein